jgi:hypothetical protein
MDDRSPLEQLASTWEVQERPFVSTAPLIGPIVARFRAAWNSVSTKWYVRAILQQQNGFNRLLVLHLQELQRRLDDADARLIDEDHDLSAAIHDLGELTIALVSLERRLAQLEERFAPAGDRPTPASDANAPPGLL